MRFPSAGEHRRSPRLRLPMMYTVVRAGGRDGSGFEWMGRAYDISATGMRFELDRELPPGEGLRVRVLLPGRTRQMALHALGHVVRVHHPQLANGRACLAMTFDRFRSAETQMRLERYVRRSLIRRAMRAAA